MISGFAARIGNFADGSQIKCVALQIAAAALDVAYLCTGGFLGDQVVVRSEVCFKGGFVIVYAVVHQGTGALALAVQTNDALQRIVGAAGGGQQGVPCP